MVKIHDLEDGKSNTANHQRFQTSVVVLKPTAIIVPENCKRTHDVFHHPLEFPNQSSQEKSSNASLLPEVFENVDIPFIDDNYKTIHTINI